MQNSKWIEGKTDDGLIKLYCELGDDLLLLLYAQETYRSKEYFASLDIIAWDQCIRIADTDNYLTEQEAIDAMKEIINAGLAKIIFHGKKEG